VLGVDRHAPPAAVKEAYQRLLLVAHPDKAGEEATAGFQRLQAAWQV
jgi:DnaJ-class molecular chaperone